MSSYDLLPKEFISKDTKDYKELVELIKISTKLNDDDIANFHTNMWIFTHGIATLVANDTVILSDQQIKKMLSLQFQALMLLKENPNNKWVIRGE